MAKGRLNPRLGDGRCIVEPMLKDNVDMAIASYNDIRRATRGLLYECAMRSSVGGVATEIGIPSDPFSFLNNP